MARRREFLQITLYAAESTTFLLQVNYLEESEGSRGILGCPQSTANPE